MGSVEPKEPTPTMPLPKKPWESNFKPHDPNDTIVGPNDRPLLAVTTVETAVALPCIVGK